MLLTHNKDLCESWRKWEDIHHLTQLGKVSIVIKSTKISKQLFRLSESFTIWRGREWEVCNRINRHCLHLQHDTFDRHTQDLSFGELCKISLVDGGAEKTITMARTSTTSTTSTLGSGGLGSPVDGKRLDSGGSVIFALLCTAAVNNIPDSGDSEGGFGDVSGEDTDTSTWWGRVEHLELFVGREEGVEGEDVKRAFNIDGALLLAEIGLFSGGVVIALIVGWRGLDITQIHVFGFHNGFGGGNLDLRSSRGRGFGRDARTSARRESLFQATHNLKNLVLAREEYKDTTAREATVDLADLFIGLLDVVGLSAAGEVDCNGMCPTIDLKERGWSREESLVFNEIGDTEGGRHDDKFQRLDCR